MKSRPDHKRALRVVASFAVCFAALCAASEIWLRIEGEEYRDIGYSVRRNQLAKRVEVMREKDPATPLIVMVGSSRVHNGFDAGCAEEQLRSACGRPVCVANFGVPGGGSFNSLVVLGRLLREGLKPDVLLIEIMPVYLPRDDFQLSNATPLSAADHEWLNQHDVVLEREPKGLLAIHNLRTSLLRVFAPKMLPRTSNCGWVRKTDPWGANLVDDTLTAEERSAAHDVVERDFTVKLRDIELHESDLDGLRLLLATCRERQIATALVLTPEGPDFRKLYRLGIHAEMTARFEQFAAENGTILVSSWEWLGEEEFADSHHLLSSGARKFTTRLCRETVAQQLETAEQVARRTDHAPTRR